MAKLAIFVPYSSLCALSQELLRNYPRMEPVFVDAVANGEVTAKAKELEAEGCELIIARGLQAKLIRQAVKLPLVEIRVTAQELGELVQEIKTELGEESPRIGLIGFENILCDTSRFDLLFEAHIEKYVVTDAEDFEGSIYAAVRQAISDGCQAVIGGRTAGRLAKELDLCYRFVAAGRESLTVALDMANHISYAMDLEKTNNAEIEAMLNHTHSGLLRIDQTGRVLRGNQIAFNLLGAPAAKALGKTMEELVPGLDITGMHRALAEGEEIHTILSTSQKRELMVNLVPIRVGRKGGGAILTLQEGQRIIEMSSELRQELYAQGYLAAWRLERLPARNPETVKLVEKARSFARFSAPLLITGEAGTGKGILAQCIHNAGLTNRNAFVSLDCRAIAPETMDTLLFGTFSSRKDGNPCVAELAQGGTIYFSNIEALSQELQYKLYRLVRGSFLHNGSTRPTLSKVRVIASTQENLIARVERGEFRSDLYYALCSLTLSVPPLRQRREDIPDWAASWLEQMQERYDRFVQLTEGAMQYLLEYDWPGNLDELRSLCEKIVLTAPHRSVDEVFLRRQLEQMSPKLLPGGEQTVIYRDERVVKLIELLEKHRGNRQKVADELGISKTTLWRHMKKYGIDKDFSL